MNFARAVIVLAALSLPAPGVAAKPAADAAAAAPPKIVLLLAEARNTGKSFLDHVRTTYAEPYSVPATFPGPLMAAPRREPDARWMLLACFGLLVYLGRRRGRALAADC